MGFLSAFFNKDESIPVARSELAEIFAPLIEGEFRTDNKTIAKAISETAEWLRIGFDSETEKGDLYLGLRHALSSLESAVKTSMPDSQYIEVKQEHLEILRTSHIQLLEASRSLDFMSKQKANYRTRYVEDRHGNNIPLPFTQIYNRPEAAHDIMGIRLEDIKYNLDAFFNDKNIPEATNSQLTSYIPRPQRF